MFGVCLFVLQCPGHLQRKLLHIDSPVNNKVFVSTLENLLARRKLVRKCLQFENVFNLKLFCEEIDEEIASTITTPC